jgi:hypothetical protein
MHGANLSSCSLSAVRREARATWSPLRIVICLGLLLAAAWLPISGPRVLAAGCHGSGCHGLNPETLGCGADARTGPSLVSSGAKVENRYSLVCDAEWERTTNQSGGSRHAAGSIRWGCQNYCLHWSVRTTVPIANGQRVYTAMLGPDATVPAISCGKVSTSGPISVPVTSPCTGVS